MSAPKQEPEADAEKTAWGGHPTFRRDGRIFATPDIHDGATTTLVVRASAAVGQDIF